MYRTDLDLAIIVVTAETFRNVRRTLVHLRAQTVRDRLEVLVVAASEQAVADCEPAETQGFGAFSFVYTGESIENVDRASSFAVHQSSAPVVAIIEDHAYPEPDWAEHILKAHRKDWAVVGPTVLNANPRSMLSWTNLLIAYGPSTEPCYTGEREALPGHNLAFKRQVLAQYGESLIEKMGRTGGLLEDLQEKGYRLGFSGEARLAHANPSRLAPTLELRFCAGRLYGATRAEQNDWTPLHRVLYIGGGLLIPFLRFRRFQQEFFSGNRRSHLRPGVYPALFFGLLIDALGQMAGYAFGPGKAPEVLANFEMDRMQHLNSWDRKVLSADAAREKVLK